MNILCTDIHGEWQRIINTFLSYFPYKAEYNHGNLKYTRYWEKLATVWKMRN